MRLFHFSEDPAIRRFVPRPVQVPSVRRLGHEWLNGKLVWAIDDAHEPLYLFPRDCPRILLWTTPATTKADRIRWLGDGAARMVACIEPGWLERVRGGLIHRYEMPLEPFETLDDAGMFVSREPVEPLAVETIADLPAALSVRDVELRVVERLRDLAPAWQSSLHASGIRLRHAATWP
jgi:hypothetical protein